MSLGETSLFMIYNLCHKIRLYSIYNVRSYLTKHNTDVSIKHKQTANAVCSVGPAKRVNVLCEQSYRIIWVSAQGGKYIIWSGSLIILP
jgi:hypothetical protein